jgi:tight adherence protein C
VLIFLVVFATFAAVTAGVLSGLRVLTAESAVSQRLRTLMPGGNATVGAHARKQQRSSMRVLKKALAVLGQYSVGGSEDSLTHTLSVAGMRARSAAIVFLGVRTAVSFGPALLIIVTRVSAGEPLGKSLASAALAWFAGHIVVNLWLRVRARKRSRAILNALPDTLDLMIICLEAGLGLNATITRVGQERASLNDPLGQEFSLISLELRNGRSREEALRALSDRNGVDDLRSLTALVIQSDKLGASMARTLRVHADLLRTRRRQRAEEAARKLPIKMLFPLALFILPPLFTVTVGPAVLQIAAVLGGLGKH